MFRSFIAVALSLSFLTTSPTAQQPDEDGGIDLNVRGTTLGQVLEMISVQQRVNIVAGVDVSTPVTANFYEASLEDALDWILTPMGLGWTFDGRVYTVMSITDLEQIEQPLGQHIFQPNYRSASELESFLVPLLSPQGRIIRSETPQVGIPSGGDEAGGINSTMQETLLVIDTDAVIENMRQMTAEFDAAPRQVMVQATIIEVFLDETNKFGVDFAFILNGEFGDFESLGAASEVFSDPTTLVDGGLGPGSASAGAPFLTPSGTYSGSQTGFTDPADGGLRIGYVGNNTSLFIQAVQEVADTNVLANTKVLALNKQRAEIIIGGRLGYFGGTTVSDGISQQTVEFLEVGTQLRFRPFIGDDGMVRLEIHPQRSSGVVDPNTGLPTEKTSEVTTNVMVRDGDTVAIGGLIETRDVTTISRVPVLGYIPGLSWLFSSEESEVERSEIVVLLTPTVLDPGEQYVDENGETGAEVAAKANRDEAVFRESFGATSRSVYAGRLIEDAQVALENGHLDEARMLCDRALMVDPLHDGAIDLSDAIDAAVQARGE